MCHRNCKMSQICSARVKRKLEVLGRVGRQTKAETLQPDKTFFSRIPHRICVSHHEALDAGGGAVTVYVHPVLFITFDFTVWFGIQKESRGMKEGEGIACDNGWKLDFWNCKIDFLKT